MNRIFPQILTGISTAFTAGSFRKKSRKFFGLAAMARRLVKCIQIQFGTADRIVNDEEFQKKSRGAIQASRAARINQECVRNLRDEINSGGRTR